jgi:hypothetical protein
MIHEAAPGTNETGAGSTPVKILGTGGADAGGGVGHSGWPETKPAPKAATKLKVVTKLKPRPQGHFLGRKFIQERVTWKRSFLMAIVLTNEKYIVLFQTTSNLICF